MKTLVSLAKYGFLSIYSVFIFFPIIWLAITSIKTNKEIFVASLPSEVTLENFTKVIKEYDLVHYFYNSTVIAASTTVLVVVIASLAGYAFAKYQYPGSSVLLSIIVGLRMVPAITLFIPLYLLFANLHLLDTRFALILGETSASLPFAIWVLYNFFRDLPGELMEASLIDGCSRLQTLLRISLPLASPGMAVVSILTFMGAWNQFLFVLVTTTTNDVQTVPIAIAQMTHEFGIRWDLMSAAGMLYIIPTLLMTFIVQKYIVQGLTMGALKG
ncbi:carbohydrate ABC transporter permease [Paenibacillus piri]|uniref:Carbohydrate ABC transporter permease n=1 Tax=Paenibacillus piri TaxID=2547395 RepID=A0A4R5K9B1_9BACL|nr:carbohydrate ABC transporter permease [Paenibacillus piri]TDF89437.1 carbohydrate ABC transporter permease [Paenibacillus piri]